MWRHTKMFPGVLCWQHVEIDGIISLEWYALKSERLEIKMFENITRSDCFQQHNLHGDWSLEGFHRCLHKLLISKQFSQSTSLFQCFLFQGSVAATSQRIIRWTEFTFLSNPKSRESFSHILISHVLYFPNQGEYVTETPLGPGGEASYSTVSILPTSLPVCKKITRMEFLENKSMWSM